MPQALQGVYSGGYRGHEHLAAEHQLLQSRQAHPLCPQELLFSVAGPGAGVTLGVNYEEGVHAVQTPLDLWKPGVPGRQQGVPGAPSQCGFLGELCPRTGLEGGVARGVETASR